MPDKYDTKNRRHKKAEDTGDLLWEMATRDVTPLEEKDGGFIQLDSQGIIESEKPGHFVKDTPSKTPLRSKPENKKSAAPQTGTPKTSEDEALFTGLDRRTNERLRRGQMPIEAVLDLHGCRRAEAYDVFSRFVHNGYEQGKRCVLVVTGKGQRAAGTGVIKQSFPDWVRDPALAPYILQYYPAKRHHGGAGAFYVLLRKKRQ